MNSRTAFLITAYDQLREVKYTVNMLRNVWETTLNSPIVIVISGDTDRTVMFNNDPLIRVVHLDDIVGNRFKTLVSTSIMRQITHGMLEIKDLERDHPIKSIVHMHGDILLLNEKGFFKEIDKWRATGKPIAADNVGAQNPVSKVIEGRMWNWKFYGCELMPQLFVVDHAFCSHTGYMYDMEVIGDLEKKATEWALIGNLHRAVHDEGSGHQLRPHINPLEDSHSPYRFVYSDLVHCVKKNRAQWGVHPHWGGFCHFGNSLHYTQQQREFRNEQVLRQCGLDLEAWNVAR